jgi:hypothetical protein
MTRGFGRTIGVPPMATSLKAVSVLLIMMSALYGEVLGQSCVQGCQTDFSAETIECGLQPPDQQPACFLQAAADYVSCVAKCQNASKMRHILSPPHCHPQNYPAPNITRIMLCAKDRMKNVPCSICWRRTAGVLKQCTHG